jgi:short subunit dehydrogenase-like uncharacterized protein
VASDFLLYGATGFMGHVIARLAVESGLRPVLAGRNAAQIERQAVELHLECRVFSLGDSAAMDQALANLACVLHCAGPYSETAAPMVDGCLRTGTHYLDLSGDMSEYVALAARELEAKDSGVMLLPAVGFDSVAADCLALHLKRRLPSATRLTLAMQIQGPARLPPGTIVTIAGIMSSIGGATVVRDGHLETAPMRMKTRQIDFGQGPVRAMLMPWAGDVYTAFRSTGIPNIEQYPVHSPAGRRQLLTLVLVSPLLRVAAFRRFVAGRKRRGPTPEERAQTRTVVWGEAEDSQGQVAVSRLHGPEAGVTWASSAALAAVRHVLAGEFSPGFQTPALAYGPDYVLECPGVTREDVS